MAFLGHIFSDPSVPAWVKEASIGRMRSDPGLPVSSPTKSFWLSDEHPDFSGTPVDTIPSSAEYVIIGSGITGASVARELVRSRLGPSHSSNQTDGKIVVLDAREICGGATGRNGGHINEVGFADYRETKEAIGKEAAMKITRFRLKHLAALEEVATEENLIAEGQVRKLETATVFYTEEAWNDAKHAVTVFKEDFSELAEEWMILESKAELEKFGVGTAVGLILARAGAAWPYRLVSGILSNLERDDPNFSAHPFAPVTEINKDASGRYVVSTPRGNIVTTHVIHCTNSHIGHLVPSLRSRIFPVRGQMSAQTPPSDFPFQGDKLSWSLNYSVGFDYLTQIPQHVTSRSPLVKGQEMMLGGGMVQSTYHGIEEFGVCRDDELNDSISHHLSTSLSRAFTTNGVSDSDDHRFKVKAMWTGIMGFSADSRPWVGKLEPALVDRAAAEEVSTTNVGKVEGAEWISAGYTGEGMVNAWLCGKALAMMITGREAETASWFPREYLVTAERIQRSTIENCLGL